VQGVRTCIPVVLARAEKEELGCSLVRLEALEHLVKDVKRALAARLRNEARLFEQVRLDLGSRHHRATRVEGQFKILAKPRRVVISQRLGVAKGLEHRIVLRQKQDVAATVNKPHAPTNIRLLANATCCNVGALLSCRPYLQSLCS
jgi:hypothetical protein